MEITGKVLSQLGMRHRPHSNHFTHAEVQSQPKLPPRVRMWVMAAPTVAVFPRYDPVIQVEHGEVQGPRFQVP
jgi:hypothetical protein